MYSNLLYILIIGYGAKGSQDDDCMYYLSISTDNVDELESNLDVVQYKKSETHKLLHHDTKHDIECTVDR